MSSFEFPIPLAEIESVLAWVDTFKLSRPTKKINRDFSDAVLLAEILSVHYPKLVEMHNYPPRNSHSLKLNNWMTLNRKVLKKLKLGLCTNTMEQLANCANGVIERVLVMVRDKIRRDEELNKSLKDTEQNMSSGGSYYEACGEDENVLVVPVKSRVNGVLETIQQKVVNYELYTALKEELKDAKDSAELLKQKVEHLDNLLKLREERIDELQKQLERKQTRRKESEALQNILQVPFETVPSPTVPTIAEPIDLAIKTSVKSLEVKGKEESKIPIKLDSVRNVFSKQSVPDLTIVNTNDNIGVGKPSFTKCTGKEFENNKTNNPNEDYNMNNFKEVINKTYEDDCNDLDRIKSDVFKEIEIVDDKIIEYDEFKDTEPVTTIEQTIQKEIKDITNPMKYIQELNY